MNFHQLRHKMGRGMFLLVGLISVLSISATFFLAGETIFLPLIVLQDPSPTPTATATLTPTVTLTPTQTQETTPQPPDTLLLRVTPDNPDKDWALAYFVKSYNDAGRPVMEIYPSDSSLATERIRIPAGEIVLALDTPVLADGGGKFWQLVEYEGRDGEELFLRAEDVTKLSLSGAE